MGIFKLCLASTSPFRKDILSRTGLDFFVRGPECDEKSIVGLPPRDLALQRAILKGKDVAGRLLESENTDLLVVGADQVLSLDATPYDKANSREEAIERLSHFSGKAHFLHSAVCLVSTSMDSTPSVIWSDVVDLKLTMKHLNRHEVEAYIDSGEWVGCVGCYRIEGLGRGLFESIPDDQDAIIGLPMKGLMHFLRQSGRLSVLR